MRRIFQWVILSSALLLDVHAEAQSEVSTGATGRVLVEVSGEAGMNGILRVALFVDPEEWLKEDPFRGAAQRVDELPAVVIFSNVPVGEYAISLFLDENDNEELDTGLFMIPQEPYGFSNNARKRFGPADFEDAKFSVESGTTEQKITIKK